MRRRPKEEAGGTVRTRVNRRAVLAAWCMLVVAIACWAAAVAVAVSGVVEPAIRLYGMLSLLLFFGLFMPVGAVIVAHRPGHPIGWVYSAIGLLAATGVLAQEYAVYAYTAWSGALPGALLAAWYQGWWWLPGGNLAFVFAPLLFPTGRLLSPRWRAVAAAAAIVGVVHVVVASLAPAFLLELDVTTAYLVETAPNPIGRAGAPNLGDSALLSAPIVVCMAAAVLSVAMRFRRARGVERQQLKWFTYAVTLMALAYATLVYLVPPVGVFDAAGLPDPVWGAVVAPVPVATGIAILRHRLLDIDRLINRTVVYGVLTAMLGAIYATLVLALGLVFGGVREDLPDWVVAATTLVVAALFQPARRRVQAVVDWRFNRRRHDAAKTVDAFGARLRDQVNLDVFSAELSSAVDETMQPTWVALWLRPAARSDLSGRGSQTTSSTRSRSSRAATGSSRRG